MQVDPLDTTPLVIVYAGVPASLIPVEHLYDPSTGTAADAEGVPVVSTDVTNKKGNRKLNDFVLVNTGHSPTLDNQKSELAQLVTPKDHPEIYLRGN